MALYLLDTNVIIHVLRGREDRSRLLATIVEQGHVLAGCPVTTAEVYAGMQDREEMSTRALVNSLVFLHIRDRGAGWVMEARLCQEGPTAFDRRYDHCGGFDSARLHANDRKRERLPDAGTDPISTVGRSPGRDLRPGRRSGMLPSKSRKGRVTP